MILLDGSSSSYAEGVLRYDMVYARAIGTKAHVPSHGQASRRLRTRFITSLPFLHRSPGGRDIRRARLGATKTQKDVRCLPRSFSRILDDFHGTDLGKGCIYGQRTFSRSAFLGNAIREVHKRYG
jgi:hypothetical protein